MMKTPLAYVAVFLVFGVILLPGWNGWAKEARDNSGYGRYQLVPGEYDVKIGATGSGQPEYVTHRTMFLIDTQSGQVWLFVVESDWLQGRWGWVPAKGFLEKGTTSKQE
jgi:hypothetical protein